MTESRKCGEILEEIADTIDSRHGADPSKSYVAQLFSKAPDGMLKKVAEEASEVIMAAKDGERLGRQGPPCLRDRGPLVPLDGGALLLRPQARGCRA